MNEKEVLKCPKCGSSDLQKKNVRIPGSLGFFNPLELIAYVCKNCNHVEFYEA